MNAEELKSGYEEVFTVTDYYDGPRKGVANFNGLPHFYDCIFDDAKDEYSDAYQLTPISHAVFQLANEDWLIWKRWEAAFHAGTTSLESHPALPRDRARHLEIRARLDSALRTDATVCVIRRGLFERLGSGEYPEGVIRPLQVRWSEIEDREKDAIVYSLLEWPGKFDETQPKAMPAVWGTYREDGSRRSAQTLVWALWSDDKQIANLC